MCLLRTVRGEVVDLYSVQNVVRKNSSLVA